MRRIALAIITPVIAVALVALAHPALASASTHLCNVNGTRYCLGDTNITIGFTVVQKNPSGDNARDITVTNIDGNCPVLYDGAACERVYLSYTTNGDRIISTSDTPDACSDVEVGSPSASTGSVWFQETESGTLHVEYVSQMCHNANAGDLMMGDNNHGDSWVTSGKGNGSYWTLDYY
jgi:hypothetical protein